MNKRQKNRKFFSYTFFPGNRRGFLLAEETLKLVISVIAIGFLAYLLFSLYFSFKNNELEQAEASLDFLMSEIKAGRTSADIYNPEGWWILSGNNELCICKDNQPASCGEKGVCEESFFVIENSIKIEPPPVTLQINQETKIISN